MLLILSTLAKACLARIATSKTVSREAERLATPCVCVFVLVRSCVIKKRVIHPACQTGHECTLMSSSCLFVCLQYVKELVCVDGLIANQAGLPLLQDPIPSSCFISSVYPYTIFPSSLPCICRKYMWRISESNR